jgi:hypothetical protein
MLSLTLVVFVLLQNARRVKALCCLIEVVERFK